MTRHTRVPFRAIAFMCGLSLASIGLLAAAEVPCQACHAAAASAIEQQPHGKIMGPAKPECDSCHSGGEAHVKAPSPDSIFNFESAPVAQQNAVCTACHQGSHEPSANAHSAAGIACTSCHAVHSKKKPLNLPANIERLKVGSTTCYGCHQSVFSQFAHNERHRLLEGALECISCHDPHKPKARLQLGGFKQSLCSKCHADVEGPFVFEHAASRVEGCGACHAPHGSPNRHLLVHQEVGSLCYSCHADAPQFHLGFSPAGAPRFDKETVCTNCHIAVHGSNVDRALLR